MVSHPSYEILSPAASDALYTISSIDQGDYVATHMVKGPHLSHEIPDVAKSPLAGKFAITEMTANFVNGNPKIEAYLGSRGFAFAYEKQDDGGIIIDATYPNPAAIDPITSSFQPTPEGSYNSTDFMMGLQAGRVLMSANAESGFDLHDSVLHRPMWELLMTLPEFLPSLGEKAGHTMTAVNALPPRDPNLWGPEPDDLAIARQTANNRLEALMGIIDFQVTTGSDISNGIQRGSARDIARGLRELFSAPESFYSQVSTVPDERVSDSQIADWADRLVEQFSTTPAV